MRPPCSAKSNLTTRNVKSVHLVLSVNGKIKHLPIKTLTGDLTTTPDTAAQGNADITFGGSDIDAQFVVDNGTLYAAMTPGQWESFGPAAAIYDPSEILNPNAGLANVLTNISNPEVRITRNDQRAEHGQDHRHRLSGRGEWPCAATEGHPACPDDRVDRGKR